MNKLVLGIDFGTSSNFVTKYDFNRKDAVPVANMGAYGQNNIFENCIYIEGDDKFILGDPRRASTDPFNFFYDIKRHIASDDWRHKIPNLGDKEYTAQDIAEFVFRAIRKKVEENENKAIDGAVITVPYSYTDKYKTRIKEAAEKAGIKVIRLVEEPVAAAISFGIFGNAIDVDKKEKIVVFDLGGGTFDITVFEFQKNSNQQAKIEVLNTDGVADLGGRKIDALISEKFRDFLGIEYSDIFNKKELSNFKYSLNKAARSAKETLSSNNEVDVYEPLTVNLSSKELELTITREGFNNWLKDNNIVGQIEGALERAIYDIDIDLAPEDIDRVVLAGGTSNIPLIKDVIRNFFGKEPESKKNLGELVGHGAGILAGLSEDSSLDYEIIRKTSKFIGVAKGNKFQKVLFKNTCYGEESPSISLMLKNHSSGEVIVNFYEGDSAKIEECEKLGKAIIDGQQFSNGIVKLKLAREDDSGLVKYFFYDENNILFNSDFI